MLRITLYLALILIPALGIAQDKVGINTTAPVSDLDIRGTDDTWDGGELQLATPTMSNYLRFFGGRLGDRNPFIAFSDQDTFHFVTTSVDWLTYSRRMSISPTGNVGIGTQQPLSKLDIKNLGDGAELLRLTTDRPWLFKQTNTGINTALTLKPIHNDKAFEIVSANGLNKAARFFTNDTYSKVLLVPDAGEVGIGITEATAKLHVRGNSSTADPQLRLTETSINDFARIKMENENDPGIFWDIAGRADSVLAESRLNFYYAYPGYTGDKMTIMGNGNVGIGTTTPLEKLHVVGTMRVSDLAGTGDRNVIVDSNGKFKIGTLGSGDSDWVETDDYVYNNTHLIGIGTSTPTSKLVVVGAESNGTDGALKLVYAGTPPFYTDAQSMVLDGNEIDVNGTLNNSLVLQGTSTGHVRMVEGGGSVGIGQNASSNKKLAITGSPIPGGTLDGDEAATLSILNNSGGFSEMMLDGNEIHSIDETLNINTKTTHNVVLTSATGGNVGIGITPTSKLTVSGTDNNGTTASLEIRSGSQKMLMDGNELDVVGGTLFINNNSDTRVAIGTSTSPTGYLLSVGGKIIAEEVRVQLIADWPDYVFKKDYTLMPLEEVKESIATNGHLPGIPSAAQIEDEGLHLGDMQRMMMEKIEELTLHVLDLHERIKTLETENASLRNPQK